MRIFVSIAVLLSLALPASAQPSSDPLAGVASAVRRNASVEALAILSRLPAPIRREPRARYLRARVLERLGRFGEAGLVYPSGMEAAGFPEAVRDDSARRRGVALAHTGHCREARDALFAFASDPVVQAQRAECALAIGDHETAVTELRAVVARRAEPVDQFAARSQLAEALNRSGDRDAAITTLTRLLIERIEHPEAERVEATLEELTGGPIEWSFTQRMRRAERLDNVRRHADALEELNRIERPTSRAELRRYLHLKGMTLYRERHHYVEASEVLTESAALFGSTAIDDQFHAARALSRADRDTEAVRAYRRFARQHRSHARAPEATYLAAWLEIRHGTRGGERRMRAFVRGRLGRRAPRLARSARWHLALAAFQRGRLRQAATGFAETAGTTPDPLVQGRGLYWLGRARQANHQNAAAIAAYRRVLYIEPLHWYALLARQRLEELGEPTPAPFAEPRQPASDETPPEVVLPAAVRFYSALGLRLDARRALRAQESSLRRGGGTRSVAAVYRRLGEATRPLRLLGGPSTTRRQHAPGAADRWRWDAAYPRPWPDAVARSAESVELTPAHLYSVMRQESAFNPDAVSYADAIGLMQLIEPTARRMARDLGLEYRREMLFEPATNVRLGARYIGALEDRFGVPLAFAAFNAGEARVETWLGETGRIELDLFVERIPYQQSRNYIRRVTTHYAHYRYLEDPDGGWPLTLPTHVSPVEDDE